MGTGRVVSRAAYAAVSGSAILWLLCACGTAPPAASSSGAAPASAASAGADEGAAEQPAPPSDGSQTAPDVVWHMRASFWDTLRARDALIEGDLAGAKRAAVHLAEADYDQMLPAEWKHWVAGLQQQAAALNLAANLEEAGQALGRMALVCGECHELHDKGPEQPRAKPLPWEDPPDALDERMHRHQLGVVQMWDGLVLPSEEAWRSGTVTITRAPLRAPEQAQEPVDSALQAQIEAVRELARQARRVETYEERGRVYGELIARCASCHYTQRPVRERGR